MLKRNRRICGDEIGDCYWNFRNQLDFHINDLNERNDSVR